MIVPSLHACSSKQRWYSTAQSSSLHPSQWERWARACHFVQALWYSAIFTLLFVRPSDGNLWYSTIFACSSKLDGIGTHCHLHSWSEPTPTSPRIQLTAVSRPCPLLPFSRFSSLRRSLLPPFSHCCRLFFAPLITRPRPKKDFRGGDKQLGGWSPLSGMCFKLQTINLQAAALG